VADRRLCGAFSTIWWALLFPQSRLVFEPASAARTLGFAGFRTVGFAGFRTVGVADDALPVLLAFAPPGMLTAHRWACAGH
jgi:hypothetical protein